MPSSLTGRTLGDFTIKEKLGEGGYGVVYVAEQRPLGRDAVVKVMHARHHASDVLVQRFLREAKLASRLDHPYTAHVYAFGAEPDGLLWIAMERVRGTPLSRVLEAQPDRRMSLARWVPLLERLCEVVHTAHEQGIVHRDLKPDNVMVIARAGRMLPKLLDLGVARLLADDDDEPATAGELPDDAAIGPTLVDGGGAMTQRGQRVGSPYYMAPEQWTDATRVDARTDLYALGVMTFEALAGRMPFDGTTLAEVARGHLHGDVPALPDGPEALDAVLRVAMARKQDDRHAGALVFAAAVRAAAGMALDGASLPRLDDATRRDAAWAPEPIAEAVAAFEAARNPHQARDAAWAIVDVAVRYLGVVALASATRTRSDAGPPPAVRDQLRELHRRELTAAEWLALARGLVAPFASARDAHPVPELVDLLVAPDDAAPFAALAAMRARELSSSSEERLRDHVADVIPLLGALLRALAFLSDYPLVCVRDGAGDAWMGPRRARRARLAVTGLHDGDVALVDLDGRAVLALAPLVQVAPPVPGGDDELFVLAGPARGRGRGARLVAEPHGFERVDDAVWDWLRRHLLPDAASTDAAAEATPYLGLHAFTEGDAARYVGRERQVEAFTNRLRVQPLLAVAGPSGAGKSSFVRAGVVPALPATWHAIVMRPGATPAATLAARLEAAPLADGDTRVIVVDQFEEVVTLCRDDAERARFVAALCVDDPATRVVLTVRDDFLARVGELPGLRERLASSVFLLATPAPDDLRRIVVEPARRAGYDFDAPDLPDRMVRTVADRPGALPLLSFTAARLWELRDRHFHRLTRKAYDALGGVEGALAAHADATLDACTSDERRLVREALRHLVTSEGTRAVVRRRELDEVLGGSPQAAAAIERLIDARLVVATDGDAGETLELVHEALLTAWPRLVEWRREDAEGTRLRDQLHAAARQWDERGRPRGLLWRDDALDDLRRWRARWPSGLPAIDEAFADASLRDARRGRRLRRGLATTALAVLVAGLVVLALFYRASERNAAVAQRRLLDTYIEQGRRFLLDGDYLRALPYLAEAYAQGDRSVALRFLLARAMDHLELKGATYRHSDKVRAVAFRPGNREVISIAYDGSAARWDAETGEVIATLPPDEDGSALGTITTGAIAIIPRVDAVVLWNGDDVDVSIPVSGATAVAVDPDRATIAIATEAGTSRWDVATRRELWNQATGPMKELVVAEDVVGVTGDGRVLRIRSDGVSDVLIDGTNGIVRGERSFTTYGLDHITTWTAGSRIDQTDDNSFPNAVAPWRDTWLAIGRDDGAVRLADLGTGRVSELGRHSSPVVRVVFSDDGRRLASSSLDRTVRVWDVETRMLITTLATGGAYALGFSSDDRLGVGALNGEVTIWNLREPHVAAQAHAGDPIDAGELSADGSTLITVGSGGVAAWAADNFHSLRHLTTVPSEVVSLSADRRQLAVPRADEPLLELRAYPDGVLIATRTTSSPATSVAHAPDSSILAAGTSNGRIQLWRQNGQDAGTLDGHRAGVIRVRFASDGTRLFSTSADGSARVWDPIAAREIARYDGTNWIVDIAEGTSDGELLTAGADGVLRIHDRTTMAVKRTLVHHDALMGVAVSHRGTLFAAATTGGTIHIWDASTSAELSVLRVRGTATSVTFSPDGERLIATTDTGAIVAWDLSLEERSSPSVTATVDCHDPYRLDGTRLLELPRAACEPAISSRHDAGR